MTINKMKSLEEGDKVVQVRKSYQNYDHTKIPCEPKVFTISSKAIDIHLNETVKKSFLKDGMRFVNAGGCDRQLFCSYFETFDDYVKGDYIKDVVLDKSKWKCLEEFLDFKLQNDFEISKKIEKIRVEKEKA